MAGHLMKGSRGFAILGTAVLALVALPVSGQSSLSDKVSVSAQPGVFGQDWAISVMPRMGIIQPGGAGPLQGWQPEGLRIRGGPVGGVAFELQTPIRWFAVRGTVDRSLRNNLSVDPHDPQRLAQIDPFFASRAQGLQSQYSLGGVLRPFHSFPVRPTGMVGMGVRHWSFDPGNLAASLVPRFPETQWDRTWHYGAGLEFDAAPFLVRTEVLQYRARAHDDLGPATITDRFLMLSLSWVGGN